MMSDSSISSAESQIQTGDQGILKDFDILAPPKRIAKLGGEEIDVSIISTRVALKFIEFSKKHKAEDLTQATQTGVMEDGVLEDMLEIIALVCQKSSEKITKNWLLDNVDIGTLLQFVKFVFNPLTERVKEMTKEESEQGTGSGEGEETKN